MNNVTAGQFVRSKDRSKPSLAYTANLKAGDVVIDTFTPDGHPLLVKTVLKVEEFNEGWFTIHFSEGSTRAQGDERWALA